MYKRKIVLTGKSSFVVTLPKEWIEKHGLKRKNDVIFMPLDDGSLLLTPTLEKKEFTKTITYNDKTDINHLKRLFYSAYLGGYTRIEIVSDSTISSDIRNEIKMIASNLMGVESGAETPTSMTMKNMIQSEGIKFQDLVSTLMEMTHSMHEITFEALRKADIEVAKFVLDRDKEVNPKNLAIVRMMNTYLQDLTLTQSLGVSLIEAQSYFATSLYLEMLADLAVSISRNVIDTVKLLRSEEVVTEIVEIGVFMTETMKNTFKNWENKNGKHIRQPLDLNNVVKANKYLDNLFVLNNKCKILMKKYQEDPVYSIFYAILEKIRRSIKILSNICLVTIDLVEGKLPEK